MLIKHKITGATLFDTGKKTLREANLSEANLSEANLSEAKIELAQIGER